MAKRLFGIFPLSEDSKPSVDLETRSMGDFSTLYLQLHEEMETHVMKPENYVSKVASLEALPLDPYLILQLDRKQPQTKDTINAAYLAVIEELDTFEMMWKPEMKQYRLAPPVPSPGMSWGERHGMFYTLVKLILAKRAYQAREQLLS